MNDPETPEFEMMKAVAQMCLQSLSPEKYEQWIDTAAQLFINRKALQGRWDEFLNIINNE